MFLRKKHHRAHNWRNDIDPASRILRAYAQAQASGVLTLGSAARIIDGILYLVVRYRQYEKGEMIEVEIPETFGLSYSDVLAAEQGVRELCHDVAPETHNTGAKKAA